MPPHSHLPLVRGADFGWPYCYYDLSLRSLVLAPEYGGDGKTVGLCAQKRGPIAAFPAHWAPNDLAIYGGQQFPTAYRGGAFIAFHGSWNRAPFRQGGYNVVFQPLADGKATGLAAITKTITDGVPRPKNYGAPMPPMGGAQLSPAEVSAVSAYVWALGHGNGG